MTALGLRLPRQVEDRGDREHADDDEDQRRDDRPAQLGLDVAVDLLRQFVEVTLVLGPNFNETMRHPPRMITNTTPATAKTGLISRLIVVAAGPLALKVV